MGKIKPRDWMATVMNGGVPARTPYHCDMPEAFWKRLEDEAGRARSEIYRLDHGSRRAGRRGRGKPPWDQPWGNVPEDPEEELFLRQRFERYLPAQRPPGLRVSEYGAITVPGSMYHLRRMIYPLESATRIDEIDEFPWPDVKADWRWEGVEDTAARYREQGYWLVGGVGSLFETSWFIRGQQQLLIDTYENPELAAHLLDRVAEDLEYIAKRLARMGADSLSCGDDMGHQRQLFMSPHSLRRWILSRWERIIGAAKAVKPDIMVDFHSDGRCEEMLPDMMAIGVTAINPVQPECDDPEHLKRTFGRKLILKGTLSSHVLTFGSPEEIRAEVAVRMDTARRYGGMVITPNNSPDVNTPFENFRSFLDACEQLGVNE